MDLRIAIIGALVLVGIAAPFLLRRRRVSPLWMVVGALALGLVTALVARRSDLNELTAPALAQARTTWARSAPDDYDLRVQVHADRLDAGSFEIEVRDGEVTRALQNGIVASSGESYSVDGLFEILQRELELSADASRGFGAPGGYRAYLHVKFHSELGYPEVYRRAVGGTSNGVEIRIEQFTPR